LGATTNTSNQEVAAALVRAAVRTTHTFLREGRGKMVKKYSLSLEYGQGGGSPVGAAAYGGGGSGPIRGGGQRRWAAARVVWQSLGLVEAKKG
jgi:hypothetical protein